MDYSLISAAATSIGLAKELAKTAIGLRDFNQVSATVSQLNEQLLKAQDALFAHNAQMLSLQQQHFEATQKLRELEKAIAERQRYSLFELSQGFFVYRLNIPPEGATDLDPRGSEPLHYICQICLDQHGFRTVLRVTGGRCICSVCNSAIVINPDEVNRIRAARLAGIPGSR